MFKPMINQLGLSYEAQLLKKHYKSNQELKDPITR
jgi:hypothetical protein